MAYEELQNDIVDELADDWLSFGQVSFLAREYAPGSEEAAAEAALAAIAELMRRGKVVAGFIGDGFEPWDDQGEQAIARMNRQMRSILRHHRFIEDGDICWFDLADRKPAGVSAPPS